MFSKPYCKYFNDDCIAPFCSAFSHSKNNRCPYIIASEEELDRMDKEFAAHADLTQEEIDEWNEKNKGDKK